MHRLRCSLALPLCPFVLLALATSTPAQESPPETDDKAQVTEQESESRQRQRQEGAKDEDVDLTKPEKVEEQVVGLREDVVEFYGSARIAVGSEGKGVEARDNASRFGLFAAKDFAPGYGLFARLELGVNLVDTFGRIFNPKANAPEGASNVIARLGYVGVDTPYGGLTFGRQWSAYYPVAVFTDRFAFSGGLANASFNAGTDGGAVGTGRADGALKYFVELGDLDVRVQVQPGNRTVPLSSNFTYGVGVGTSLIYDWGSDVSLGVAYNLSRIDELTEELEDIGITGDAQALLLGLMYKKEPFYFAITYSDHKNHDTDDRPKYIDARGGELYVRYTIKKRYRALGGFNYLITENDPDSRYDLKLGLLEFQYSLRDATFQNILFAELLIDRSRKFDGSAYPNAFVVGFRWTVES